MRQVFSALLVLVLTTAILPLQLVAAGEASSNHVEMQTSTVNSDEAIADCCELPMGSMHHGNVHCSMDCPAIANYPTYPLTEQTEQFLGADHVLRLTQIHSVHFRPPIFN